MPASCSSPSIRTTIIPWCRRFLKDKKWDGQVYYEAGLVRLLSIRVDPDGPCARSEGPHVQPYGGFCSGAFRGHAGAANHRGASAAPADRADADMDNVSYSMRLRTAFIVSVFCWR